MSTASIPPHCAGLQGWLDFFRGQQAWLPQGNLGAIAQRALDRIHVVWGSAPPSDLAPFAQTAASAEHLLAMARKRTQGRFPSVFGEEDGWILASKLVLNWNVLLVEEQGQKLIIIQGVSCCDALIIPGDERLLIVCHIDRQRVADCISVLCREPAFFKGFIQQPAFGGYLVGHSRPYHCLYDSMLGLEALRESGELDDADLLFSREGESFFRIDHCLGLQQVHHTLSSHEINARCSDQGIFLLYAGFWVKEAGVGSFNRLLADHLDQQLRSAALTHSSSPVMESLSRLSRCKPLIWVGVTGQKRSWLEQVEGTAEILNRLAEIYPTMGVVFDGWTSPLNANDYHKTEARRDDRVISRICRKLRFKTKNRIGVLAGLPLMDKIRVGLDVDVFLANFTTGSLNVARICAKPGVGHMSQAMMRSRGPHIHHQTLEIDSKWVVDEQDPMKPTGYINYSIPWQAVFNQLATVLSGLECPRPVSIPFVEIPDLVALKDS